MSKLAETILVAILTGVVASLAASLVFWYVLFRLRPNLIISEGIARTPRHNGKPGNIFRFKIVNKSKRPAVDVQVLAYLETLSKTVGGHQVRIQTKIDVHFMRGTLIPGKCKTDHEARHARRVRFDDDLDVKWTDDQVQSIVIRVVARDGLSGSIKQFERIYPLFSVIEDGELGFADDCKIHPIVTRSAFGASAKAASTADDRSVYPS